MKLNEYNNDKLSRYVVSFYDRLYRREMHMTLLTLFHSMHKTHCRTAKPFDPDVRQLVAGESSPSRTLNTVEEEVGL